MVSKGYPANIKPGSLLSRIGFFATVWWAVTFGYLLLLVLMAYGKLESLSTYSGFWQDWGKAINTAYLDNVTLQVLFALILIGWVVCGAIWLTELKRRKISYKTALKDLFFTIR